MSTIIMINRAGVQLILTLFLTGATAAQAAFFVSNDVSGELGYRYINSQYNDGDSSTSNMITGRINSDAYLWQPWFATLGFTLDLSQDQRSTSNGDESSNNFITGNVNLNVLPMSLYPFTASYQVSDSRIDSSSANDNPLLAQSTARQFTRNQLKLTQGVQGKRYRFNFHYDQDEADSDLGEQYTQEGYGVDYSLRGIKQNLSAKALFSTQSNNQNNNESDNIVVSVNHNYYPSSYTTLDTQASHVNSNNYIPSSSLTGITQQVNNTIDQASTTLGWHSSTMPLRINGSLRVHQMDYLIDNGTTSNNLGSSGINSSLGANYQFSDRLTGTISGTYNIQNINSQELHSDNESASLNYSSERYTISEFNYGWNSSLTGTNQQSDESNTQSVALTLGHGVTRDWRLQRRSNLRLSLFQSIQEAYSQSSGPASSMSDNTRHLTTSLNLGWSGSSDGGSNSMAQLSLSDTRGIIGDESSSQMANLQLSRSQILSNRSSLNGNLIWQAWHSIQESSPDEGIGQSSSASASYRFSRPFTLQQVNFVSDLRLTDNRPAVGAQTQEIFWDNRLNHEIGMMRSSLGLTMHDRLGTQSTILMFSVKRMF